MENEVLAAFPYSELTSLLRLAFPEDLGTGDITSLSTIPENSQSRAYILSKDKGILCGLPVIEKVFQFHNANLEVNILAKEGQTLSVGDPICELKGPTHTILACERIILNFMQFLSGVATLSNSFQAALHPGNIKILDTRKTLPGYRKLQKYAVLMGGGKNHRQGLFDHILIKDNHIKAAGGARKAVDMAFSQYGHKFTIECEVETQRQLSELVGSEVNWIMLDNMDNEALASAVRFIRSHFKKVKIEASGNMDLERIKTLKHLDLDFISVGALTHSVRAFDFSLKFKNLP